MKLVEYLINAYKCFNSNSLGNINNGYNSAIFLSTTLFCNESDVVMDIPLAIYTRANYITLLSCARERQIIKKGIQMETSTIQTCNTLSEVVRDARYSTCLCPVKIGDDKYYIFRHMLLGDQMQPIFFPFMRGIFSYCEETDTYDASFKPGIIIGRKIMEGKKGVLASMKNNMAIPIINTNVWYKNILTDDYLESSLIVEIADNTPMLDIPVDSFIEDNEWLNYKVLDIAENELAV